MNRRQFICDAAIGRVQEPRFINLVPKGRLNLLNLAQDASPGLDLKGRPSLSRPAVGPAGTAENGPQRHPPSAVPAGLTELRIRREVLESRQSGNSTVLDQ